MFPALKAIQSKDYKGGHAACLDMIRKDIHDARPYYALGIIAYEHDNIRKASELFEKAAHLAPDETEYHIRHAQTLTLLGCQADAKAAVDHVSGRPITNAFVADAIGVIYSRTGFHETAIGFFQQAVALNPDLANFHYNLGASLQFSGQFKAAESAYLNALERDPTLYRAYSSLVVLEKQTPDNSRLDELKTQFSAHSDNPDAALHFGHAIAKTLEDLGEHEASLDWLIKAKAEKKAELPFDRKVCDTLFYAAKQSRQNASENASNAAPIFIVGLPRTGTTLVDRILSSHPDVTSAGELNMFAGLIKEATGTPSNFVMDGETLRAASQIDLAAVGRQYMANTAELARGALRQTDKMPLNFFYAGLIHQALPNARIIALRRGAMDSCLSNFRQLFSTRYSYYNYTFELEDTAYFYTAYDDLMAHWRNVLPADRFMEIHYEKIVDNQEEETRKLLSFCGLDWDEACMRFHENDAPVSTASSVQVRQPLYRGSINRWKRYGHKLDGLKEALGDLAG